MKKLLLVSVILSTLAACSAERQQARGFSLPAGNAEAGKTTFVELKCNGCHSLPDLAQLPSEDPTNISVALGGKVARIKTYGELVTSVINPSHRFAKGYPMTLVSENGQSKMPNYNDVMTVTQLVDVVSYLQTQYELHEYRPTQYRHYHP